MASKLTTYIVLIVVVVVVILAAYLFLGPTLKHTTSSTTTTTTATPITTTSSGTSKGNNYTNSSGCLSTNSTTAIFNGDFSTGNFLGWNVTGTGFGKAPVNITEANAQDDYYSARWSGYNGTYFATTHEPGTSVSPGNMTSETFKVVEPYINFQIVSPQDNLLYVELLQDKQPVIISHYNTFPAVANQTAAQSTFVNVSIPVSSLICQNISIRVVAGVVSQRLNGYKFIAVGNFYMSKVSVQTQGVVVNRTVV